MAYNLAYGLRNTILQLIKNIKNADYISLCVGGGDVVAFPGELMSRALDEIINEDELDYIFIMNSVATFSSSDNTNINC